MAINVEHITKFYGTQKAVDDISFSLQTGEICGFLGPNGAGKSTLMKIITACITDYTGELDICGINMRQQALKAKKRIGYLPEHNPLYPDMYIREYLEHIARLYHIKKPLQRVNQMIERIGLTPEVHKKIGQLSKGYRQRVGLAQALIHEPEILILDEPMTGLDPNQLEEIRSLIRETGKNKTILLSTHIMQEVEALCDRVIIIKEGKIVTDKPIHDLQLLSKQQMNIYIRFAPSTDSTWLAQSTLFKTTNRLSDNYWQVSSNNNNDPRVALFQEAASRNCPIIELKMEEYNLEGVFKEFTL